MELDINILAIILNPKRKITDKKFFNELLEDIWVNYLQHRITVRKKGPRYQLLDGLYRVEAFKRLGHTKIPARIVD